MTRNRVTIIALSSLLARLLVTVWPSFDIGTGASDKEGRLTKQRENSSPLFLSRIPRKEQSTSLFYGTPFESLF